MAGEKLLRGNDIAGGGAALRLAVGEEDVRLRDQEDVVVDGRTLRDELAPEEGGKKGVERLHSLDGGRPWGGQQKQLLQPVRRSRRCRSSG